MDQFLAATVNWARADVVISGFRIASMLRPDDRPHVEDFKFRKFAPLASARYD
jgi:hypothetical protein